MHSCNFLTKFQVDILTWLAETQDESLQFLILIVQNTHGVQRRMISVDNFFLFLRLLFFALLLLFVT